MKKIIFLLSLLFSFSGFSQPVSRNTLTTTLYGWGQRDVPVLPQLKNTFLSFHNIVDDGAAATATNAMAFTNKSGNVSMWTNDNGYLTSATAGALYVPLTRNLTINNNTFDLSATRSWTTNVSATSVKTTSYLATYWDYVPIDCSAGSFTLQLPATPPDGIVIGYKMIATSSTNSVLIKAGGSDVFNKAAGSTSLGISLLNQGQILQYKALSGIWYVISDNLGLSQLDARYTGTVSGGYVPFTGAGSDLDMGAHSIKVNKITFNTIAPTGATWGQIYIPSTSTVDGPTFQNDNAHYAFTLANGTKKAHWYVDTTVGNIASQISTSSGVNLGIFSDNVNGITWGPKGVSLGFANYNPSARACFAPGTATMQALRFFSGPIATGTNVIAGGWDFLTDDLYFTITTGAAQKKFVFQDGTLTAGRVSYNGINGRLIDDAGFTYNTTLGLATPSIVVSANATIGSAILTGNNSGAIATYTDVLFQQTCTFANLSSMTSATSFYFSPGMTGVSPNTGVGSRRIVMPWNCTLIGYAVQYENGAQNSSGTCTLSIRQNTTNTVLTTLAQPSSFAPSFTDASATNLSQSFTAGDTYELFITSPTWGGTAPANVNLTVILYFKRR